jgi:hypothetical protein
MEIDALWLRTASRQGMTELDVQFRGEPPDPGTGCRGRDRMAPPGEFQAVLFDPVGVVDEVGVVIEEF